MEKQSYIWTAKAQRLPKSKVQAGQPATVSGRPLHPKQDKTTINAWLKNGYIEAVTAP